MKGKYKNYINVDVCVDTYVNADVDIDDIMEQLNDEQLDYLYNKYFKPNYTDERVIDMVIETHQEIELWNILHNIYNNRFSLTEDEEMLIRNISKRL